MATGRGVSFRIEQEAVFMNCIIQGNIRRKGWRKALSAILASINVRACTVGLDGMVQVSGFAIPDKLFEALRKLKKRAQVLWLQYGECSSNLFGPDPQLFRGVFSYRPQLLG